MADTRPAETTSANPNDALGFYTEAEVAQLTSLSPVTIWRRIRDGEFPRSVKLSPNRVGWPRAKVQEWMRDREAV